MKGAHHGAFLHHTKTNKYALTDQLKRDSDFILLLNVWFQAFTANSRQLFPDKLFNVLIIAESFDYADPALLCEGENYIHTSLTTGFNSPVGIFDGFLDDFLNLICRRNDRLPG